MADAVFPVPCSLKQKDFLFSVIKDAVSFWWSNGLYWPGQLYRFVIGDGAFMFNERRDRTSSNPHFTTTLFIGSSLLLGIAVVICFGLRTRSIIALSRKISMLFSVGVSHYRFFLGLLIAPPAARFFLRLC